MRQDLWLQATAISSLGVALAIVGVYLTLCLNLHQAARGLASGAAVMLVLDDKAPESQGRALAQSLAREPQVSRARYIGKDEALKRFRRQLGPQAGLLKGREKNPLPQTVEVLLRPGVDPAQGLIRRLAALESVREAVTSRPWLSRLEKTVRVMTEAAAALGLLLFAGVVFLVANTVRLAVYVRRDQLEVMALVGASASYMRLPFLWEAVIQALAAALIASALVTIILEVLSAPAALPMGLDLSDILVMNRVTPPALTILAAAAGVLGGYLGVGRALRPRGL
jgi:cell division transport system permease protein